MNRDLVRHIPSALCFAEKRPVSLPGADAICAPSRMIRRESGSPHAPAQGGQAPPQTPSRGIVMIEAALAVLVLAVGVLAAYALFRSGLEHVERARQDTLAALFADQAFQALEAAGLLAAESRSPGGWEGFWNAFQAGETSVTLAAAFVWDPPPQLEIAAEEPRCIVFTNAPLHTELPVRLTECAVRYRCRVDLRGPEPDWTNRAALLLEVWPGEWGSTQSVKASAFYREFRRPDFL